MPAPMPFTELYNQAAALRQTAETMIKAGYTTAVEVTTRTAAEALLAQAKMLLPSSPVIGALTVREGITWSEVLTIATLIGST
jgi:hypothetical protein